MNSKSILLLIGIAALGVVGAMFIAQPAGQQDQRTGLGEAFFPALPTQLATVQSIELRDSSNTTTLRREGDRWLISEAFDYPAVTQRVNSLLQNIVDIRRVEEKTSNPARFAQVSVEDITDGQGTGRQIRLLSGEGQPIAALIVGRIDFPQAGRGTTYQFVRVPTEQTSWLITPSLSVSPSRQEWMETQLFTIGNTRVRWAEVRHADGEFVRVEKQERAQPNWDLLTLPQGRELSSEWRANELTQTLTNFRFDDVLPASVITADAAPTAVFRAETFEGLLFEARTFNHDGRQVVLFRAEAPEKAKEEGADLEAIRQEVAEINRAGDGWAFVVPQFILDRLLRRNDFFLAPLDEEDGSRVGPLPPEGFLPPELGDFLEEDRLIEEFSPEGDTVTIE